MPALAVHAAFHPLFRLLATAAVGLAMTMAAVPGTAGAATTPPTSVVAVPGKPVLLFGAYDLGKLGYRADEYFLTGTATSYALPGPATADGVWNPAPAASAKYATRVVVFRPTDPAKFNGTVLVEWLNVTAGQDTPADWMVAHREMIRKGYAWIGVSAQKVGVEGGDAIMAQGVPLKKVDPVRYASLSHPGDAYSYDIFSQAGAAVKAPGASGLLGPLVAQRVLAIGESQSAAFLTTYVNAVDHLAGVYDGFLIHSRFGSSAALDGSRMVAGTTAGGGGMPADVHFRPDLRVPLLTVITETDMLGGRLPGYHASRVPDSNHLRVWELAGAAHADNYLFGGAFMDTGLEPVAALAKVFTPSTNTPAGKLARPANPGMPHHYVVEAAIANLDNWVRNAKAPPHSPLLALASGGTVGSTPSLARDPNGLAEGGIRTPWMDAPTIRLSGAGDSSSLLSMLVGSGEPFDAATLARLYPGGKPEYLRKFTKALDSAIAKGFVLPDDRADILAIADLNFPTAP